MKRLLRLVLLTVLAVSLWALPPGKAEAQGYRCEQYAGQACFAWGITVECTWAGGQAGTCYCDFFIGWLCN